MIFNILKKTKKEKQKNMAGYKVMLRAIAIIIVLGIVGFSIYYVVSGGFQDARASYKTHASMTNSDEYAYMKNLEDDKISRLTHYVKDDENALNNFNNEYKCYIALDFVINEMGDDLYFAPKNAKNKKSLDSKYSSLKSALKKTYKEFEVFDQSYNAYTNENSASGTTISAWEEQELCKLAPNVFDAMKNLSKKAYDLSSVSFDFVVAHCLNGSIDGSLKYSMLSAINGQARAYYEKIHNANELTGEQIGNLKQYAVNGVNKYKAQKAANFADELNTSSNEYAFKIGYNLIEETEKAELFASANKQEYVNSLTGGHIEEITKTCKVMGWII